MTTDQVVWPGAWRSVPLWSLFKRVKDVEHPDEVMLSVYRDHGVVRKDSRVDNFNKTAENRNIYQLVDVGWLIVNRMKAWQGSLGISPYRGIVSGHYICFRPSHSEDPKFLDYLLRSGVYRGELMQLSRGVRPNQIEIDNEWLRVLPVHLPPPRTQRVIASYLDVETRRTDALIARKRRLIELLELRRGIFIRGKVARVHDPVAYHALKRSWRVVDCKHRTPSYTESGYPVVSPGDVTPGRLDLSRCHRFVGKADFEDLTEGRRARRGDIIYSRNASIGIASFVATDEPFTMGQDVCLITSDDGDQRYLTYYLNTFGLDQLDAAKVGSTFSRVNISQINELLVPVLSKVEQSTIADELDSSSLTYQRSIESLARQIDLLVERRQALITAAVTGASKPPGVAA